MCTVGGIVILVAWKDVDWCMPFYWITGDPTWNDVYDHCNEGAWAAVAFVCAALWFAVAGCLLYFVKSGRHASWEEQLAKSTNSGDEGVVAFEMEVAATSALEMVTVQQGEHIATAITLTAEEGVIPKFAAATMMTSDSHGPPGISDKVDDAWI